MSQSATKTRVIDGTTYEVGMLNPDVALDLMGDVLRLLGPAVGPMLGAGKDDSDARIAEVAGTALVALGSAADKALVRNIVATLMRVTVAQGVGKLEDNGLRQLHFHGRVFTMLKVVAFAVEVNYADFFDGMANTLTSAAGRVAALREAAFGSPPVPAGISGASS